MIHRAKRLALTIKANEFDPVFVHASARGGSTYFFHVLRRNDSLMCFNEAIVDGKIGYARYRKSRERDRSNFEAPGRWDFNHHFLDRMDCEEFLDAWDHVMHLCPFAPTFHDYLAYDGVISAELSVYLAALMRYSRSRGKRPALCEVYSRGRAGALRGAFGGYHIAQYRDPLSQFGSFLRALIGGRVWYFLANPLTELGTNSAHPLYRLVPEAWRAPNLPWRAETRAQRFGSEARYFAVAAALRPDNLEKLFRWHMFSWILGNLAAISYSDLILDLDKVHDESSYRAFITGILEEKVGGATPDFSDIQKFERHYDFESFDVAVICEQVISVVRSALEDGRLDAALSMLGKQPLLVPTTYSVELLANKILDSLSAMAASASRHTISVAEWREVVIKNRRIWFNPGVRWLAEHIYPVAAAVVRSVRWAGIAMQNTLGLRYES
jgi:hypothetical protein